MPSQAPVSPSSSFRTALSASTTAPASARNPCAIARPRCSMVERKRRRVAGVLTVCTSLRVANEETSSAESTFVSRIWVAGKQRDVEASATGVPAALALWGAVALQKQRRGCTHRRVRDKPSSLSGTGPAQVPRTSCLFTTQALLAWHHGRVSSRQHQPWQPRAATRGVCTARMTEEQQQHPRDCNRDNR